LIAFPVDATLGIGQIHVSGDWDLWKKHYPLSENGFVNQTKAVYTHLTLSPGQYLFKFRIGTTKKDVWRTSDFYPIDHDSSGNVNNKIMVPSNTKEDDIPPPPQKETVYVHEVDTEFATAVLFPSNKFEVKKLTNSTQTQISFVSIIEYTRQTEPRIKEALSKLPKVTHTVVVILCHSNNAVLDEATLKRIIEDKGAKVVNIIKAEVKDGLKGKEVKEVENVRAIIEGVVFT